MNLFIAYDVGGTQIKTGILSDSGQLVGDISYFDAHANRDRDFILNHFLEIFLKMAASVPKGQKISGMGMAFPGNFDYEHGISLIQGLDKYGALYGVNIKEALLQRIRTHPELVDKCAPGFTILFLHDIAAFLLGKIFSGMPHGQGRVFALCIGTGAGSSFAAAGTLVGAEFPGVPENGWIYNTPFENSMIDDYVSVRGLHRIAEHLFPQPTDGKTLYCLAQAGDVRAKTVFQEFGLQVTTAISPFLLAFRPDVLLLGGQIAKSFCYFGEPLQRYCDTAKIEIQTSYDTSKYALIGLFQNFLHLNPQKS